MSESINKINIIHKNLLESDEPLIVHQTNCISTNSKGLASEIFKKYPYADVYSCRRKQNNNNAIPDDWDIPGTISIKKGNGPIIVAMFAQYDKGNVGHSYLLSLEKDNQELREKWFKKCLKEIKIYMIANSIKSVGFPYKIGCGLAGGNWEIYNEMIEEFSKDAPFIVNIYKLE